MASMNQSGKTRIAHLAGPTATIQNTPPLVTSNKARAKHGLPLLKDADGAALKHDALRSQRLAAPAKVYVEQFSAHPLELDVAELYGPPDGYIGADGAFRKERQNAGDKAVYEIELKPEDGLYPLPYMATQADGSAWDDDCTTPGGPKHRQGFFPDGSRSFEEIDRMAIGTEGHREPAFVHCNDRFLPRRAAKRLHQGSAGAAAPRQGAKWRHRPGSPRHAFLRLQALSSRGRGRHGRRSPRRPTTCRRSFRAVTTTA